MLLNLWRRGSAGFLVFALSAALYACSGSSEKNRMDWSSADYAAIICSMPDAGCKTAAEQEKEEEHRGHHGHRSRGGKR